MKLTLGLLVLLVASISAQQSPEPSPNPVPKEPEIVPNEPQSVPVQVSNNGAQQEEAKQEELPQPNPIVNSDSQEEVNIQFRTVVSEPKIVPEIVPPTEVPKDIPSQQAQAEVPPPPSNENNPPESKPEPEPEIIEPIIEPKDELDDFEAKILESIFSEEEAREEKTEPDGIPKGSDENNQEPVSPVPRESVTPPPAEPEPVKQPEIPSQPEPEPQPESPPQPKVIPSPEPTTPPPPPPPTPAPEPTSINLGQLNLDLIPPFEDPSVKQFKVHLTLLNQLELGATLQELYQGEIAPGSYETIYQISAFNFGNLALLSGTLTLTSAEPIRLDNLSSSTPAWQKIQFQLVQQSDDLVLVGRIDKEAPSDVGIHQYRAEVSFQAGEVSGSYKLRLESQLGVDKPCPWVSLDHELVTKPQEVLYFHSYVDHICNNRPKDQAEEQEEEEEDRMNIEITLKSELWPLANFHLNQTFEFGPNGQEEMTATHPLVNFGITGFWNGDSLYSKTLKLSPTAVGSKVLPLLPASVKAIFTRYQLDDGKPSYNIRLEKFAADGEEAAPGQRLTLSSLVVKVTGAFISATTVVLSANGALLSGVLAQLENLVGQALVALEIDLANLIPLLDSWQCQLALELTVFVLILLFLATILSAMGLLDSVVRLALIIIFVEICVVTIGVQLITIGFF